MEGERGIEKIHEKANEFPKSRTLASPRLIQPNKDEKRKG